MPTENDFIYYATGVSPNVVAQATYAASAYVGPGLGSGILASAVYNKMIRQGTAGSAMLAQFIVNQLGQNVLDNGNLTTLVSQLTSAIQQSAVQKPARVITVSTNFVALITDWWIGLSRSSGPAATQITMPASPGVGQELVIEDVYGNASAYPITLVPSAGTTFKGKATIAVDADFGAVTVVYGGSNLWGYRFSL